MEQLQYYIGYSVRGLDFCASQLDYWFRIHGQKYTHTIPACNIDKTEDHVTFCTDRSLTDQHLTKTLNMTMTITGKLGSWRSHSTF